MSVLPKLEKGRHRNLWSTHLDKLASSGSPRDSVSKCKVQSNEEHTQWCHLTSPHEHTLACGHAHTRMHANWFFSATFFHMHLTSPTDSWERMLGPADITVWRMGAYLSRLKSLIVSWLSYVPPVISSNAPAHLLCVTLGVSDKTQKKSLSGVYLTSRGSKDREHGMSRERSFP